MKNTEWDYYEPLWLWSRYKLTDGSLSNRCELLMRRRVNGQWQYRRPTSAESAEWQAITAW